MRDWIDTRIGEVIIGRNSNPALPNHVASGFRVVDKTPEGLVVRRIHSTHLYDKVEQWTMNWEQLRNYDMQLLPVNTQLPLL